MEIKQNYDLTKLNTFGVSAKAKFFAQIENESDLQELFKHKEFFAQSGSANRKQNQKIFLGGGSNILFTKDFEGMVILNKIKGIEVIEDNTDTVVVKAKSGEIWHDLVLFAVERKYWGLENLSFIPGTVGAAPMQNIGAYGIELKTLLQSVEAYDIDTGTKKIFNREECEFGYRDSIFKNRLKDKYFISAVIIQLSKTPKINTSYKILQEYLEQNKITVNGPKDISDAVTIIRKNKLPDPKEIGNAGSFFKNVILTSEEAIKFLEQYPTAPSFQENLTVKIPAGWLIEQCGPTSPSLSGTSWKGYKIGNVGVHDRQALVLVNHGGGTGEEIKELAKQIIISVKAKFGLELIPEVNFI